MKSKLTIPQIHLGEEIKKKFDDSGLTQREFGARIGMSQQNVHRVFDNQSLDTKRLIAVSQALNFNFFELFCDKSSTHIQTEGDLSPASSSGNIDMIIGDAVLTERIKSLQSLLAEKDERIAEFKERIKELKEKKE